MSSGNLRVSAQMEKKENLSSFDELARVTGRRKNLTGGFGGRVGAEGGKNTTFHHLCYQGATLAGSKRHLGGSWKGSEPQ